MDPTVEEHRFFFFFLSLVKTSSRVDYQLSLYTLPFYCGGVLVGEGVSKSTQGPVVFRPIT